jgi:uncharacterized protein YkwD
MGCERSLGRNQSPRLFFINAMRFFYTGKIKQCIFAPAVATFCISLLIQISPLVFFTELSALSTAKTTLGYPASYYANNTLLILKFLFAIFYAFLAGTFGLIYFRIKHRKSGYTLLTSNAFHMLCGLSYLLVVYALLHIEAFNINPDFYTPKLSFNSFTRQIGTKLRAMLIPQFNFNFGPVSNNSYFPANPNNTQSVPLQSSRNTQQPQSPQNPQQPQQPQTQQPVVQTNPPRMAGAQELYNELNNYRSRNGRAALSWDGKLGNYAQNRANLYASLGNTDNHAGFNTDLANGSHNTLCFFGLGENSGYGGTGSAVDIIDHWYGESSGHNANQLNSQWTHVGIGVNGVATDLVFGGGQITSSYEHAPAGCR